MTDTHDYARTTFSRRKALSLLGLAGVALVPACRSGRSESGTTAAGATSTTAAGGSGTTAPQTGTPQTATCVLTPESTEGPFYLDLDNVRRDITDGKSGAPLELRITVVDAVGCAPIADATVDIWHADAGGAYSSFSPGATGQTFLRGTQVSGADGAVTFDTVYPGWYRGRAVHIHTKVHVSGSVVHTGQLYFADDATDDVYRAAPYSSRPGRDVRNAQDGIFRQAGADSAVLDVTPKGNGYAAGIVVGVERAAAPNQA